MKVGFAGDWHGNSAFASKAIARLAAEGCSKVIQLGDFGFWPGHAGDLFLLDVQDACTRNGVDLYVVRGNHDDADRWKNYGLDADGFGIITAIDIVGEGQDVVLESLHFIPDGHIWQWCGRVFGGIGGASSIDREYRLQYEAKTGQKLWWPEEMVTPEAVDLLSGSFLDILVSHEGPTWGGSKHDSSGFQVGPYEQARTAINQALIDVAARLTKPRVHIHGHHHNYAFGYAPWRTDGAPAVVITLDADVNHSVGRNTYIIDLETDFA